MDDTDDTKLAKLRNTAKQYKQGIKFHPLDSTNYINLGLFYVKDLHLPHLAEKYIKEAIKISHGTHDYYHDLYYVENEIGNIDEAIVCLEKAISIRPNNGVFFNELGKLYLKRKHNGDASEALRYFDKAISLNGFDSEYYFNAAKTELILGNYDKSFSYAKMICRDPFLASAEANKYVSMYNKCGLRLGSRNENATAMKCYRDALAFDKDPVLYYNLARAYESLGKKKKALKLNRIALKKDPNSKINREMINRLTKTDRRTSLTYNPDVDYSAELNRMIGLTTVKKAIRTYLNRSMIHKIRRGKPGHGEIHLILEGHPGTGKSTVGKLLCAILYQKHIISKPHFVMVNSTQLIYRHYGESAQHVRHAIHRAMGGVLFIDEAYHLMHKSDNNSDCEDEAVDELLPDIEKHRNDLVVIMAGYQDQMEKFLNKSNPGLGSRFPDRIKFPDYNNQECIQIMRNYLDKNHFQLSSKTAKRLFDKDLSGYLTTNRADTSHIFSNARTVRNVYSRITNAFSNRLMHKYTQNQLRKFHKHHYKMMNTITSADVKRAFQKYTSGHAKQDACSKLNKMIGLKHVKSIISDAVNRTLIHKIRTGSNQHGPLNMVFEGNPGTGKTTVAKLFCKILYEKGITKSSNYVYVAASSLPGKLIGESAENMRKVIKKSLNGVLFIDEAYDLARNDNKPIIDQLISDMSKYKNKLVVILAGYPKDMENLMTQTNAGLSSRFPTRVIFPDYTSKECCEILNYDFSNADLRISSPKAKETLKHNFSSYIKSMRNGKSNFANARVVNNYFSMLKQSFADRLAKAYSITDLKRMEAQHSARINSIELADIKNTSKRLQSMITSIGTPKIGFQASEYHSSASLNN